MADNQDDKRKSGKNSKAKDKTMNGFQIRPPAPAIHGMLGEKLKAFYAEVANEPIPERLTALLAKLEAQSAKKQQS